MKTLLGVILFFISGISFSNAQDGRVPEQHFISEHHIKTISAKLSTSPDREILRDVWTFDQTGNMISHRLFDESDTVLHIERYNYSNNLLIEKHVVAHMNFSADHADSVITIYSYNDQHKLTAESSKGFKVDRMIQYNYENTILTKKIYFDNAKQIKSDSMIYFSNQKLFQVYHSKSATLTSYSYTLAGQMETQQECTIGDTNAIFNFSK